MRHLPRVRNIHTYIWYIINTDSYIHNWETPIIMITNCSSVCVYLASNTDTDSYHNFLNCVCIVFIKYLLTLIQQQLGPDNLQLQDLERYKL